MDTSSKKKFYRSAGWLAKAIFMAAVVAIAGVVTAVVLSNILLSGDVPVARDTMVLAWETPDFESADAIPTQALVTDNSTANTGDSTDWFYSLTRNFTGRVVHTTAGICGYDANDTRVTIDRADLNVSLYVADTTTNQWTFVMELNISESGACVVMTYDSLYDMIGTSQMYKLEVFFRDTIPLSAADVEMSIEANT